MLRVAGAGGGGGCCRRACLFVDEMDLQTEATKRMDEASGFPCANAGAAASALVIQRELAWCCWLVWCRARTCGDGCWLVDRASHCVPCDGRKAPGTAWRATPLLVRGPYKAGGRQRGPIVQVLVFPYRPWPCRSADGRRGSRSRRRSAAPCQPAWACSSPQHRACRQASYSSGRLLGTDSAAWSTVALVQREGALESRVGATKSSSHASKASSRACTDCEGRGLFIITYSQRPPTSHARHRTAPSILFSPHLRFLARWLWYLLDVAEH